MIFKDRSSQCRTFYKFLSNEKRGELQGRGIYTKASINYSREKNCVCGLSIVAYQDSRPDRCTCRHLTNEFAHTWD